MKIGITTDSSSGIDYLGVKTNVLTTRTSINFKTKSYVDGVDIDVTGFYRLLRDSDEVPTTSAPTPQTVVDCLNLLKADGCTDVIHFCISTNLSDYGKNLKNLIDSFELGVNFCVYDGKTSLAMEGIACLFAEQMALQGLTVDQIFTKLDAWRKTQNQWFVVDDLKYLVKNGRLSGIAGGIGTLLHIKPVLILNDDGRILPYKKVRTYPAALEACMELLINYATNYDQVLYIILHGDAPTRGKQVLERFSQLPNCAQAILQPVTPTVGTHVGGGIIGMSAIQISQENAPYFAPILTQLKNQE